MYRLSRTMVVLLGVATLAPHAGFSQSSGQNSQEAAIRSVIQAQIDAWNRHDLEAFMAGYWNSPNLTFFSGATETQGWQPTLERYRKKYQSAPRWESWSFRTCRLRCWGRARPSFAASFS